MPKEILLKSQMVMIDVLAREIASARKLSIRETLEIMWQVVCHDETIPVYSLGEGLPYKLDPIASCNTFANGLDLMTDQRVNEHVFFENAFTPTDANRIKDTIDRLLSTNGSESSDQMDANSHASLPPYLDHSHPRYAPKLAAAIHAWMAVGDVSGKHPKQALAKWLREHAAEFDLIDEEGKPNETGIDETAKVANWQPVGGAPKTPGL